MNITDEHLQDFITYTIEKLGKHREREVRDFYGIFWKPDPVKVRRLFTNSVPIIDGKPDRRYLRRMGKEFHLIADKGFYKVFYQVAEILSLTRDMIHVIRGSSGSSIVCYLMGITHIDPIQNNICLARFMHTLRDDMPDIDMDFPTHLRDEVYARIYRQYPGSVARISNHVHYGPKTAMKQALKNAGVTGFIPKDFNYKEIIKERLPEDTDIDQIIEEAKIYNGTERYTSLHCGGIFILDGPIPQDLVYQEIEVYGVKAYQVKLDKDETENSGFIKIDILSNRGLSVVTDVYEELNKKEIHLPRFECLPIEQPVMDSLVQNNIGIVYAESRGMYKIFSRMRPRTIDDLSVALALIRPAAASNGQKSEYLRAIWDQPKNPLEPQSQKNWIIYDDDAITYIAKLLSISEDEADGYRKAFSKDTPKALKAQREFYWRALKRYSKEQVDEVVEQLKCLQEYGFCKSHSYSYAYLIYALAYLKYHYPAAFWKAALNHCQSSYRPWVHYREASKHLKLTHMPKPYRLSMDAKRLLPIQGTVQPRLFSNPVKDFIQLKYWTTSQFLPGMYYRVLDGEKVQFRGIIATYRPYWSQDIKGRKITFITLGYDNGAYIDILAYGHYPMSKWLGVEGIGKTNGEYITADKISPISI